MNPPNQQPTQQQINIKAEDKILRGVYANLVQVNRTKEEFVFDFINMFPPTATLNARIILSPAHAKRLAGLLANVVKQYEDQHGPIEASKEQDGIGFDTSK